MTPVPDSRKALTCKTPRCKLLCGMAPRHRWVYFAPAVHLSFGVLSLIGMYAFRSSYAADLWVYLVLADIPASLPYYFLAWKYGVWALCWVLVAGTGW